MSTIHRHDHYVRGCPTCSRRAVAEAVAPFVKANILSLREARRAVRGRMSEDERQSEIRRLRSRLNELLAEEESERRTDEDERRSRTAEPTYSFVMDEDGERRRADETEEEYVARARGRVTGFVSDEDEAGSNIEKPETNTLRGGRTGQQRSGGTLSGETGVRDPHRSDGRAREAIREFVKAGIVKG